jgi:hypothetical protein
MEDPQSIILIARAILVGHVLVVVLIGLWAFMARLPDGIRSRYPERTVYWSQLPFTEEWRSVIAPEHLPLFVRARTRRQVLLLALVVLGTYMPLLYGYLSMVAEVWQCHLNASGQM